MGMKNAPRGPSPTTPTLAGVVWQECYNCYHTRIAGWLDLSFNSYPDGYKVKIAEAPLKALFATPEQAAQAAVSAAKTLMRKAITDLGG